MTAEIKITGRLAALGLKPGDVLIVQSDEAVSTIEAMGIRKTLTDVFPGHEVLIFDEGMRLQTARFIDVKPSLWARALGFFRRT